MPCTSSLSGRLTIRGQRHWGLRWPPPSGWGSSTLQDTRCPPPRWRPWVREADSPADSETCAHPLPTLPAASGIQANTTLRKVCIGTDSLGDTGASTLLKAVSGHPTLAELDLENKGLTGACLPDLAAALAATPTLTTLRLGRNAWEDGQALAKALAASTSLHTVHLAECGLTASSVQAIAEGVGAGAPALRSIDLSRNALGSSAATQAALAALAAAPTLQHIALNSTEIGPAEVSALADARGASTLHLQVNRNPLGPRGVAAAVRAAGGPHADGRGHCEAQWCIAEDTDEDEWRHLAAWAPAGHAAHLAMLDLKGCVLGPHGSTALAAAVSGSGHGETPPTLHVAQLSVFGSLVGDDGAAALVAGVLATPHAAQCLQLLDLGGNGLTDTGVQGLVASLLEGAPLPALSTLDLSANVLTEAGTQAVEAAAAARGVEVITKGQNGAGIDGPDAGKKPANAQEEPASEAAQAAAAASSSPAPLFKRLQ